MRLPRLIPILAAAMAPACVALACPSPISVDQVGGAGAQGSLQPGQITAPVGQPVLTQTQISRTAASAAAPPQLAPRVRPGLASGPAAPRTASAPAPLSTPAQGRSVAAVAVGGHDRCEPGAAARAEICNRIPEAHPDDFAPSTAKTVAIQQTVTQGPAGGEGAQPAPVLPPSVAGALLSSGAPDGGVTVVTLPPPK